jgi:hypothetical protein
MLNKLRKSYCISSTALKHLLPVSEMKYRIRSCNQDGMLMWAVRMRSVSSLKLNHSSHWVRILFINPYHNPQCLYSIFILLSSYLALLVKDLWWLTKQTPWPEFVSELYRHSDPRLSAKLVKNFADRGCCVVSTTNSCGHIVGLLDRNR